MTRAADVIVIGAGVIGAAVAYELAKQGKSVLSLDAKGAAGHGSTAGSCAIVRVHLLDAARLRDGLGGVSRLGRMARLPRRADRRDAGRVPADRLPR